jgi:hypothetical protein
MRSYRHYKLKKIGASLPDPRTGMNGQYTMKDAVLSAFSVFFTQSPSFLGFQRDMERKKGKNNVSSLFGVFKIPTDAEIRNLMDPVDPHTFGPFRFKGSAHGSFKVDPIVKTIFSQQ